MTEKIQYFMSDLSYKLGIGEITEIHVAEQNGRPVLRITCDDIKKDEYKTVQVPKGVRAPKKAASPKKQAPDTKPMTLPEKLALGAKDFFLNPERNKNKPFGGGGW
jgi:hypothetical protein